jgi:hypothetical protein
MIIEQGHTVRKKNETIMRQKMCQHRIGWIMMIQSSRSAASNIMIYDDKNMYHAMHTTTTIINVSCISRRSIQMKLCMLGHDIAVVGMERFGLLVHK